MNTNVKLLGAIVAVFALVACLGAVCISEDSDAAGSGTSSDPYDSLSVTLNGATFQTQSTAYIYVGSTVSIRGVFLDGGSEYAYYEVLSVTSGYGLSISDYESVGENAKQITGTISKVGTITITYLYDFNGDESTESFSLIAVESESDIDFSSPDAVSIVSGGSVSYQAETNISATFAKSGGTASWLSVSSTGLVTGTAPSVSSVTEYTCIIKATSTNVSSNTATQTVTFTVYPAAQISASPSNTITGTVGSPISSVTLSGNLNMTFSASGWPAGISMSNGVISGTPTSSSSTSVTVYGYTTEGPSQTAQITIAFNIIEGDLSITSTAPSQTFLTGSSYSYTPTASLSGVTWTISNAPEWLSVSSGSVVGQIPTSYTESGSVTYTLTAKSAGGQTAIQQVTVNYEPQAEFTSVPTASCIVEPIYNYDSDGNPTLASSAAPIVFASYALASDVSLLAEDDIDYTAPDAIDAITGATITYNAGVNISGSTFQKVSGADWLSVSSAGVVSGTAPSVTTATDYQIVVRATSPQGQTLDQTVTITVYPIAQLSANALSTQVHQGSEMSSITVTSNVDVTFSKTGELPNGVTFDVQTGVLSGTPTERGTFTITVYGATIDGPAQNASIKISVVVGEPVLEITSDYPSQMFLTGSSYTYTPTANVDGVTWSIFGEGVASGTGAFLGVSSGSVVGQIPTSYTDGTTLSYTLKADSPEGQQATQTVYIVVEPQIAFTTIPTASCVVNPEYDYADDGTPSVAGTVLNSRMVSEESAVMRAFTPVSFAMTLESPVLNDSASDVSATAPSLTEDGTRTFRFTWTGENADMVTWDFGDGTTGEGFSVVHTYAENGTYTYTCTGTNSVGSSSISGTITVNVDDGEDDGSMILLIGIVVLILLVVAVAYYLHKRRTSGSANVGYSGRNNGRTNGRR